MSEENKTQNEEIKVSRENIIIMVGNELNHGKGSINQLKNMHKGND